MRSRIILGAVALLVALSAALPATGGSAAGAANATNTVLSLQVGSLGTKAGIDRAVSHLDGTTSAEASLDFLVAGTQSIVGGSRKASKAAESGSQPFGIATLTIPGFSSVQITGGSLDTTVESSKVTSSAVVAMANLSLLDGLVNVGTVQTSTTSTVTRNDADVLRTLRLGAVDVLSIRELLNRFGIDPLALACSGLEAAALELNVPAAQACETLDQIKTMIGDAQSTLSAAMQTLQSDLATASQTIAGVTIVLQPLVDLAAVYGLDWSGLLGMLLGGADRQALIDEIERRIDAVGDGTAAAASSTCTAVASALDDVSAQIPSMAAELTTIKDGVTAACSTLQGLLDNLLDTSILRLDGVRVALNAQAVPSAPFADGSGSIGSIFVGNTTITAAGVASTGKTLQTALDAARSRSSAALTALGIGAFPMPELELLKVSEQAGVTKNGTWFAKASVTGIHLLIPSVPISRPTTEGMNVLASSTMSSSASKATANAPASSSPLIAVDAAVFTGDARYNAAGDIDFSPNPAPLPRTGAAGPAMILAGAIALAMAFGAGKLLRDVA